MERDYSAIMSIAVEAMGVGSQREAGRVERMEKMALCNAGAQIDRTGAAGVWGRTEKTGEALGLSG